MNFPKLSLPRKIIHVYSNNLKEGETHNFFEGLSDIYVFVKLTSLSTWYGLESVWGVGNRAQVQRQLEMQCGRLHVKMKLIFLSACLLKCDFAAPRINKWSLCSYLLSTDWPYDLIWPTEHNRSDSVPLLSLGLSRPFVLLFSLLENCLCI